MITRPLEVREVSADYASEMRQHDVPPGYKCTEVGIMPDDWDCVVLTIIARLESGHTPSKREPSYWGGTVPWVSLHDTEALDGKAITDTAQTITEEGLNNSSARLLPKGTVVFSRTATVGKATTLGREMATSQDFANYVCGPRLHNHFLVYLFRSMGRAWQSYMAGSIHNTIYMPVFESLKIALPPIPEQCAIAEALSDVDGLIAALDKLIAKKRAIKQAVMQQLLTGRTRLPGFEKETGWRQTEAGVIPKDWIAVRLGECLVKPPEYGINAPAVPYSDNLPTYVRITDISDDGRFSRDKLASVDDANAGSYFLEDGDLVFARTGASVGKSYLYNKNDGVLAFAGFLIRIRPEKLKLVPAYLASYVTTSRYWVWITLMSMRSGQPGVNGNEYAQLPIPLPPQKEQEAIATFLSDMDAEITALEARRDKTKQLKQGMMQQLLTGRIRLVKPNEAEAIV